MQAVHRVMQSSVDDHRMGLTLSSVESQLSSVRAFKMGLTLTSIIGSS